MSVAYPKRTFWPGWAVLAGVLLLPVTGCTNPHPAEGAGSWIEILEMEESPDALDVEALASFQAVEVLDDRLIFTFDGASPLRVDHVVGASGPDREGYLRRIVALNTLADGRIEAMTEPAGVADYYTKLDFIFHYDPVRRQEPTYAQFGDVGATSEEEVTASCEDYTPCEVSGGQTWGDETAGCTATVSGAIEMGPFVETDFSADFKFSLTGRDAYAILNGKVRAGLRFTGSAGAQLMCNADFAALLGGGEAPQITLAYLQIGPIPVTISATPILEGELTVSADVGEFSAEAGAEATATTEFGFKGGDPHLDQDFTFDTFAEVTTARAGSLSASSSITAGVEIEVQAGWDFSYGPADIDAGVKATMALTGTLGVEMNADLLGCGWTVDIPWSCDVQFGVGVDIEGSAWGFGVSWTPEYKWDPINLAMGSLGSLEGELPWCGSTPSMCMEGGATCHDDAYDNSVCEGMMGFQACSGGQVQYCTCTAGGWTDCGACMTL